MSISNYLNALKNAKNNLINIVKPFNSSITSSSKYDELVTSISSISNDALSTKVYTTYSNGIVKEIIGNSSALYNSASSNKSRFNEPVTIGNNIANCYYMFGSCSNFNQPINIPSTVTDCYGMFYDCYNFNQPVTIPDSVTKCNCMFEFCNNFNQPITIPNSVTNCGWMFYACYNFNQPVTIGNGVTNCEKMFFVCPNMSSNIYIKSNKVINCTNMLYNHNTSKRINIHIPNTNSNMINLFTNTSASYSITGKAITYTSMTNGYYNTAQNIYIYTNYSG